MNNRPVLIFSAICSVALAGLAAYLHYAGTRTDGARAQIASAAVHTKTSGREPATTAPQEPPSAAATGTRLSKAPLIYFRHNGVDSHYGNVAYVDSANVADVHFVDSLQCEVVHVSGGRGICLSADRGVFTTYTASLFDTTTFQVSTKLPLKGIPSRSRMSADGSLAALTVFVSGHGYTALDFSTQTLLIDVASGEIIGDLEAFAVTRNGAPIKSADFNFWGVTFTPDGKHFYATLSTAGRHYLIRGNIQGRSAEVIHENVECPSLSPDARRVAYKKRFIVDNRIVWQLHVLDLATHIETALAEKRSIDDQLEWLGDREVLYSVPSEEGAGASTDVWITSIDAGTPPALYIRNAYSPATARNLDAAVVSGS